MPRIPRRWRACLCATLVCAASFALATDKEHWQTPAYLVDSFVDIALGNEYRKTPSPVRKWTTPVNYFLVHQAGDQVLHEKLIRTHFAHLEQITGVSFRPAPSQADANFLVVMSSEDQLKGDLLNYFGWRSERRRERFDREAVCLAIFNIQKPGAITRAAAIIPVDRARSRGKLLACVVEELTQLMGLPNDSVRVFPSVFNDLSTDVFLTGLDYLLLKMLYDPRVKVGMDEQAVRPVLRQIAEEFERDGLFDTAEKDAVRSGLSALNP